MGKNKDRKKKRNKGKQGKKRKQKGVKIYENLVDDRDMNNGSNESMEMVKIGSSQKTLCLFTKMNQHCKVHFCDESDIGCYVHCNSTGKARSCVLCEIGKDLKKRLLIPVFSFESDRVEVLSVIDNLRPYALLPQIANVNVDEPRVIFVSQSDYKYALSVGSLSDDIQEEIMPAISEFKSAWEKGEINLSLIYPRIHNSTLKRNPEIQKIMKLKGIFDESEED